MRGINYGHAWTATPGQMNTFDSRMAYNQLAELCAVGYQVVRIAYPTYDGSGATIEMCKDMVALALQLPFQRVIWGVVGHRTPVTATTFAAHADYVKTVVAPYAQALNDPRFQLSVGNEEELAVDGVTLTVSALQDGIKQLMTDTKAIYTIGTVDYVTAATYSANWGTLGLPAGTKIGMNLYYEWSPYRTFLISASAMPGRFGSNFYISEWSTSLGYDDAVVFGAAYAEQNWSDNLRDRRKLLDSLFVGYDVDDCIFAYADGGFGVTQNRWALIKTDGTPRQAWYYQSGQRAVSSRDYSSRTYAARSYGS